MAEKATLIEQLLNILDTPAEADSPADRNAQQLKEFIDRIPGGFLVYRADGNEEILYANRALLRIFRCDTLAEFKQLTGNSFKGVVHSEDLQAVEQSIAEQISHSVDGLDYVEYRIIRKDGVVRRVEDYGHFVHTDTLGDIFYVFISDATDKIDRRLTETAALKSENREKEQQLQSLIMAYDQKSQLIRQEDLQRLEVIEGLSVNYESILYADLDSDKVLPYRLSTRLERQFEKKFQARPYRAFALDYADVWVHPEDRDTVFAMTQPEYIRNRLSENETYYINYRCIQNGETKYLQLRLVNVSNNNHISQIVMGYRNMDEEILQEMKQKQILQDALQSANLAYVAKNAFLSNMSHDMRTPLNAVFGYAALIRKSLRAECKKAGCDNLFAQTEEYLKKIETAGNQMLELVERVLELSYMESQEFSVSEELCDPAEVLQAVYKSALPQAAEKRITLLLDAPKKRDAVYADREKLTQILAQLVNNAVKYTQCGGRVQLSVAAQKSPSGFSSYRFTVRDTGIGIAPDYLPRIFDPFEREKNTTFSGVYGTGLGLTIAKHLVEMMGGAITAESTQGKGSTFTVTLSFRTQTAEEKSAAKTDALDFRGKKILLVEDNEINREIETELLQDIGFIVDTAANGQIAVEKIRASRPGEYLLILMDIQMPVMDGNAAAQAIRKLDDPALARIPILALSANAFESDKRASMESGMDGHLTKPVDIPLLVKTITETLRR